MDAPVLADEFPDGIDFVGGEIVHDHDLAGFQVGAKHMFHKGQEDSAVGGRLDGHWMRPSRRRPRRRAASTSSRGPPERPR